jgi:DNA-binding transcriptional LysR family regulator
MDTDQLIAFIRVVREGSFSRAAWELGLAQPTISARIQSLEEQVGGALFVRGGRGVSLSDLGISFLPYAQRALEILDVGIEVARQSQLGSRGRVSVGVLESLSGSFLSPALAQFYAAHPEVDVLVRAGRHEQLIELLRDGVTNLALLAWPCPETLIDALEPLLLLRERVVLVAAPNHPLTQRQQVTVEELAAIGRPFLMMRWWLSPPPALLNLMQSLKPTLDVPLDTGRNLVLHGAGVAFFPWMQVADMLRTGQLRMLQVVDMSPLVRDSALVRRERAAPLTAAAHHFIALLRERSQQLGIVND